MKQPYFRGMPMLAYALGPLTLVPMFCALYPLGEMYCFEPSVDDAFISIEYLTRNQPPPFSDPWFVVPLVTGFLLAITFTLMMRGAEAPSRELRPIWVVLLFAAAPFSLPVFWFCYVRPGANCHAH
jgi:hypothetical protein